jgi:hypothetical protein
VEKNVIEFVNTKVDDPESRFEEIIEIIHAFKFPAFHSRIPFTVVRKVVSQLLIARIRQLISLQPLTDEQAIRVDNEILKRIHHLNRFPYRFSATIAHLPIAKHGFGIPSVYQINRIAALEGVRRDLNHHVPQIKAAARITYADWICSLSNCRNPLSGMDHDTYICKRKGIPQAWITARRACRDNDAELLPTDLSYLSRGEISIKHYLNCTSHLHCASEKSHITRNTNMLGITSISEIGHWIQPARVFVFNPTPYADPWTKDRLETIAKMIQKHTMNEWQDAPGEVLIDKQTRKKWRRSWIKYNSKDTRDNDLLDGKTNLWATDGSMKPANAKWSQSRMVTSTATGSRSISVRSNERNAWTASGELNGIAMALTLIENEHPQDVTLYTDHLNAKNTIDKLKIEGASAYKGNPTRVYYEWISDLLKNAKSNISIEHVKSHTGKQNIASKMNQWADEEVGNTHERTTVPVMRIPTEYLEDFQLKHNYGGWILDSVATWITNQSARVNEYNAGWKTRMATWMYEQPPQPEYLYTRAVNAYSTMVQLYTRSGQLPTNVKMKQRGYGERLTCFNCDQDETENHLFVECEKFEAWRAEAIVYIFSKLEPILKEKTSDTQLETIRKNIADIFKNSSLWITNESYYYTGIIPNILPINLKLSDRDTKRAYDECHYTMVRLAGRIWGARARTAAQMSK